MTISKDRVKPSPHPDSWKLAEIFTTGIILGGYLAMMTVIFFWAAYKTDFFPVRALRNNIPACTFLLPSTIDTLYIMLTFSVHLGFQAFTKQMWMTLESLPQ